MVYCVKAQIVFSTAARRDAVYNDIVARITGKPRWGVEILEKPALRIGLFGIVFSFRFSSKLDQADLKTRIESFATGTRTPLAGSSLQIHDCTHDSSENICSLTETRRVW